jgi:methylmalonyl-CoA decarboxylase
MSLVVTEHRNNVGTLTLNHAEKRNALSAELVENLLEGFEIMERAQTRVVILRAPKGTKVWSAGHDIRELPKGRRDPLGWDDPLRRLIRRIESFSAPIVALLEGGVWGGACELALSCDILLATPDVTFAITPAKLSVPYNVTGLLTFMSRMPLLLLKEMAFTGEAITAARALSYGIVNDVRPGDEIEAYAMSMAEKIARNAPLSVRAMKACINTLAQAHPLPPLIFEQIQGERRVVWDSKDYVEGIEAFMARRPPVYQGE